MCSMCMYVYVVTYKIPQFLPFRGYHKREKPLENIRYNEGMEKSRETRRREEEEEDDDGKYTSLTLCYKM